MAYEREEAEKALKHDKSVAGMRKMREQYEAAVKADEARRTRISRKKVCSVARAVCMACRSHMGCISRFWRTTGRGFIAMGR
jgi:hypothetical protein